LHKLIRIGYVYITSHRVAPVIRITASYDSKTKITSVLAQQEHSEHFPFKTFTAWLSSASAIAHPLALLFPILGEYNAIMLRHASDAISDTGALELEIGQHNYQSKLLDQMIDLSVMDFPNVVRRLNGSSSSLACFELGCEEMIECLAQVSKLLDINHTNTPDMSSNIAQLQEFRSRIQYWNTSQKSLLLRVRFCQKIAQTQLAVVSRIENLLLKEY
jgi:hypothetical protein